MVQANAWNQRTGTIPLTVRYAGNVVSKCAAMQFLDVEEGRRGMVNAENPDA